jgi:hypothetical protein
MNTKKNSTFTWKKFTTQFPGYPTAETNYLSMLVNAQYVIKTGRGKYHVAILPARGMSYRQLKLESSIGGRKTAVVKEHQPKTEKIFMTLKGILALHKDAIVNRGRMVILSSEDTEEPNLKVYSLLYSAYSKRLGRNVVAQMYQPDYTGVVSDQDEMRFAVESINGSETFLNLAKTKLFGDN